MTENQGFKFAISNCNKPTLIFGIAILWNYLAVLPSFPQGVLYLAMIVYSIYVIAKSQSRSLLYICFALYLFLEVAMSNPPGLFKSELRVCVFALVLCCFSPMFSGKNLVKWRMTLMNMVLWFCLFIGTGSFFCKFLGINYMSWTLQDYLNVVGTFGGLTYHSMILAPLAALGAIFSAYIAITHSKKWPWALVVFCMGSVLFAASRAALMAGLIGLMVLIARIYKRFSKSFAVLVTACLLLMATYSYWGEALSGVLEKNRGNTEYIDLSSRQSKWDSRLDEFQSSPIYGVGFCAVALNHTNDYNKEGGIEPGSSWLSVLSMTGLVGGFFVFAIFYGALKNVAKHKDREGALLMALLSFIAVHMLAEGYMFSGGSLLCMITWLIIGCCTEYKDGKYGTEI